MPIDRAVLPDWPRAHGSPLSHGLIKQNPGHFEVVERLGFELRGDGEHDYLQIEKTGANTPWVAAALARHAGVDRRDVGYAGLKDRHAVTTQWFSVRRPTGEGTDWSAFELPGIRILELTRHQRKLKRGAHSGNAFSIGIGRFDAAEIEITERIEIIKTCGVPNYFGVQRFGRQGSNLQLAKAVFAGKRMKRDKRSIALSAARSLLFNDVLASRVAEGSWGSLLPGEVINLDGTGSYFPAEDIDGELNARARQMDVHPTGVLWGRGAPGCTGVVAGIETAIAERHPDIVAGLEKAGLTVGRRALRLAVHDLSWEIADDEMLLRFWLGRGSYATAVLHEIVDLADD